MAITDKLTDIADAIRAKTGDNGTMTIAQMPGKIAGISTTDYVAWHQCPEAVRDYLDEVTYDPTDYTTSQIATYAPSTATAETKALYTRPIGETVDGVIYYNEVPNIETPFSSANVAGTVKPLDYLRWIKGSNTLYNCRDLGGWDCDGGTVKYGMLFRGNDCEAADRTALVEECGVRRELDLRGSDTDRASCPMGSDIKYYRNPSHTWYSLTPTEVWHDNLAFVFDAVKYNEPVYFHCSAGADRTGTLACILEALLGVSQSDIDKDYELTCFSTGTNTDSSARRRNESDWKGLIAAITSLAIGNTFRDKVVNWVSSLGFSEAEINAFRRSMIDGNPEDVHIITLTNLFAASQAQLNTRFTSSSTQAQNGCYITNLIEANAGDVIYVKPAVSDADTTFHYNKVNCCDASGAKLGARVLVGRESTSETTFTLANGVGHFTVPNVEGTVKIQLALRANLDGTAISASDIADVIITKNQPLI